MATVSRRTRENMQTPHRKALSLGFEPIACLLVMKVLHLMQTIFQKCDTVMNWLCNTCVITLSGHFIRCTSFHIYIYKCKPIIQSTYNYRALNHSQRRLEALWAIKYRRTMNELCNCAAFAIFVSESNPEVTNLLEPESYFMRKGNKFPRLFWNNTFSQVAFSYILNYWYSLMWRHWSR